MKLDEFAFVNQQLAGMVRSGIPLEGSLRKLCISMKRGKLRTELLALEQDLSAGVALKDALDRRRLPKFYVSMLKVGVKSNDLPGMLLTLGDYYARVHALWTRLTGLLVYPFIVLLAATAISLFIAIKFSAFLREFVAQGVGPVAMSTHLDGALFAVWAPTIMFIVVLLGSLAAMFFAPFRSALRWKLPAFREASIARVSAAMSAMLKGGCTLDESLTLVRNLENDGAVSRELARWQTRLQSGRSSFQEIAGGGRVFPPLFSWIVAGEDENLPAGFERARSIYSDRANRRCDLLLTCVTPVAAVALGAMIFAQFAPLLQHLKLVMDALSG